MARTVNRQTFTVSTDGDAYPESKTYIQAEFKGMCDSRNDITVDQLTFAETNNVYVNDNNVLVSRPPLKFSDGEAYIVDQWTIGVYNIRLHRLLMKTVNDVDVRVDDPHTEVFNDLFFVFLLTCGGRRYAWKIPVWRLGWDNIPKVTCARIQDKIFIWFAGVDFIVYDIARGILSSAAQYLYVPVCEQVINGLTSSIETKNFLTDTYIRRYQYSSFSSINFERLAGKHMSVSLSGPSTENQTEYLYSSMMHGNDDKTLIYPYSAIGSDVLIDMVQTTSATVTLRYSISTHNMDISFDAKLFRALPSLDDILGTPMLTRDGFYAVAFTKNGVARCRLVPLESTDFTEMSEVLTWIVVPYLSRTSVSHIVASSSFTPRGYFETIDNFGYVVSTISTQYVYAEGLRDGTSYCAYNTLVREISGVTYPLMLDDDYKVFYRYTPSITGHTGILCFVDILMPHARSSSDPSVTIGGGTYMFNIKITSNAGVSFYGEYEQFGNFFYSFKNGRWKLTGIGADTYRMDLNCLAPTTRDDGNLVYNHRLYARFVFDRTYSDDITYSVNDRCVYNGVVYRCLIQSWQHLPTDTTYWVAEPTSDATAIKEFDSMYWYKMTFNSSDTFTSRDSGLDNEHVFNYQSKWFKCMRNDINIFTTENYLYDDGLLYVLTNNGKLETIITDTTRNVENSNTISLVFQNSRHMGNIHTVTLADYLTLGAINSGGYVAFADDAVTEKEYLSPSYYTSGNEGQGSHLFKIQKISVGSTDFIVESGSIGIGDLIRLVAYDSAITLPVGHPGNPYTSTATLEPYVYPDTPEGWVIGDDWPSTWPDYKPAYIVNGVMRLWQAGDVLPTGPVQMYGYTSIRKRMVPVGIDTYGLWYNVDGTFWTSQLSTENSLYLDEYVNGYYTPSGVVIDMTDEMPEHIANADNYYLSFSTRDSRYLLEVTSPQYDESLENFLLYLPLKNEFKFADKVTNVHPLSTTSVGVFTNDDIWYINQTTPENGTTVYSRPIKSKIPLGCRDGDEIITSLDGQAILFPTVRGITVLTPQDFVATTDQILSYLSDIVQAKYYHFYNDIVSSASLITSTSAGHRPEIKSRNYRYWVLFYKYMGREILAFDTRTSSWWIWTSPYPIKDVSTGSTLHLLLEIDFNTIEQLGTIGKINTAPLSGVSFLFVDVTQPEDIGYYDDVVAKTLNGESAMVTDNSYVQPRRVVNYATPTVDWSITSQRLHFNAINNYKAIKSIILNVTGNETIVAKLSTTAYRDTYHPENVLYMSIKINQLRTFVKRTNLMHVTNFQYQLENEGQHDLTLNSLCIKYEIKEGVR